MPVVNELSQAPEPGTVRRLSDEESGFTMVLTIMGTFLATLIMAVSVTAVQGDIHLTRFDLDHKRAYEAAQSGIADYVFHLNKDSNYWTKCANVPTPNAVNLAGSTAKRRSVDNQSAGAEYAIELIPRTGAAACSEADPAGTMIEFTGQAAGTFRIRSTGYAGESEQSIVAQFKRTSFLDFIYFTQLETSDPLTYGSPAAIAGAYQQCSKTRDEGRYNAPIPNSGGQYCNVINFISGESISGPLHTNDSIVVCGTPTFGRDAADAVEVSGRAPGWYGNGGCGGNAPNFKGSFLVEAPVLTPPPSNTSIRTEAEASYVFTGATRITLAANSINVIRSDGTSSSMPYPSNGVIYVKNGTCSESYSPYTATYSYISGCGNAYVSGNYDERLTIGAENDVIINGNIIRSGNGMLGLVANNFIRLFHPVPLQTGKGQCNGGTNGPGSLTNLTIDAAILAINHSFQVDHYDCGPSLGTLKVTGAIAQKYRGAVGTFGGSGGGTGYSKNYIYDDRLRYVQPPHFLDPVQAAWSVVRQTLAN